MRRTIKNMQVADAATEVTSAMGMDPGHNTVSIGAELLAGVTVAIYVDQSNDGGNWDLGDTKIVEFLPSTPTERSAYGSTINPKVAARYFRLRAVAQGAAAVFAAEVETLYK